ncbi:hypothetical protein K3495_g1920 [Podosphaera aphanis]|nr:hypothetical protein K3495_g1920 [Podosphaera aphanis]
MRQLTLVVQRAHTSDSASWMNSRWKKGPRSQQPVGDFAGYSTDNLRIPPEKNISTETPSDVPKHGQHEENLSSKPENNSALELSKKPLIKYYYRVDKIKSEYSPRLSSEPAGGRFPSPKSTLNEGQHTGKKVRMKPSAPGFTSQSYVKDATRLSARKDSVPRRKLFPLSSKVIKSYVPDFAFPRNTYLKTSEPHSTSNPTHIASKGRAPSNTGLNPSAVPEIDLKYVRYAQPTSKRHSNENLSSVKKNTELVSLYDELFPEESIESGDRAKIKKAVNRLEKLPVFKWSSKSGKASEKRKNEDGNDSMKRSHPTIHSPMSPIGSRVEPSVLSLNACSSTLEESDFFRLGHKGDHIESWTSVIPARDEQSLRFQGFYLILFSSSAAAEAYQNQVTRLHELSRLHGKSPSYLLPTLKGYSQENEELENLLRNFSLVPGYARLSLHFLRRPYGPRINQYLKDDGLITSLSRKTKSENMVLFSLDAGTINIHELCNFIDKHGKQRNLHWQFSGGQKAIIDLNQNGDSRKDSYEIKMHKMPSSFLLPFTGEYEARRFVRECHRQPFPLARDPRESGFPIINAEILW